MMTRKVLLLLALMGFMGFGCVEAHRVMLDTDMDTDDIFTVLYLLKQNRSEVDLKAITVSANAWADAGHAVNQLYDILYMMGRDDIPVGVGGEGGIHLNGTIQNDVGGYLPIIEQGLSTVGNCRYRQAVPIGFGGRLDVDTNYGLRRSFLPRGERRYAPLKQPTAQQVMIDTISAGPTTVLLTGAHTNFAIFLMKNPRLKKNIDRIFFMGGGIRSDNPTDHCTAEPSCTPRQCGDPGNLFTAKESNPYAEFNMFSDPFAAYKVLHSGIPITIVPLDATNTIPINNKFFKAFEQRQKTYEAQYCFRSLRTIQDNFPNDQFYTSYFMWDSFAAGILASTLQRGSKKNGENDFAEMEFLNITVVTSNKPYGINDGSNRFFDGRAIPMFNLSKGGVHSGHVQTGIHDPFCMVKGGKGRGRCKDGYTREVYGPGSVQVLVAKTAKRNKNPSSELDREFFENFLEVLNRPRQSGRFNFATQFPFYQEHLRLSNFSNRKLGKPVVLDMDMSPGDFLTLMYLLKLPVEKIDLKGILISGNGWANAASIDIVYDILHMMDRDDIPVGLGSLTPNEEPSSSCKYVKAIPNGSGGFLDTDTLFGLARSLPRGLRSYNREFSNVPNGFPKNGTQLQPMQPSAMDVWRSISRDNRCDDARKITILANGPLTNLANIITSDTNARSLIQEVYIVGGHIAEDENDNGNIFSIPSNKMSEFNFFLDPLAAKTVLESQLQITLVPLTAQRRVASFPLLLKSLQSRSKTPESTFARKLLHTMHYLQKKQRNSYRHMDMFLGETLGAVLLANDCRFQASTRTKPVEVSVGDDMTSYGKTIIQENCGNQVKILDDFNTHEYYSHFTTLLAEKSQSAVIGSFNEQKRIWQKSDSFKVGN